jgi:hypothetical protein
MKTINIYKNKYNIIIKHEHNYTRANEQNQFNTMIKNLQTQTKF